MKLHRFCLLLSPLLALSSSLLQAAALQNPKNTAVKPPNLVSSGSGANSLDLPPVAFARKGGHLGTDLARCIHVSQKSLDLALYNFQYSALKHQVEKALARGVKVRLILNAEAAYKSPEGKKKANYLVNDLLKAGAQVRTLRGRGDSYRGTQHNKFMIMDNILVETGSFNWLLKMEKENAENMLFLRDKASVKAFQTYFNFMWAQAHPIGEDSFNTDPLPEIDGFYSPVLAEAGVEFNGEKFPAASFSPLGGTGANIARAINTVSSSVDVAVFSVNLFDIVDALVAAQKRGVKVRLVTDYMQAVGESQAPGTKKLLDAGVVVRVNDGHSSAAYDGNMHHKFGIFDGKMVETGSYNWTFGGESRNYDNAVFTTEKETVDAFKAEFQKLFSSSRHVNMESLKNGLKRAKATQQMNANKARLEEAAAKARASQEAPGI